MIFSIQNNEFAIFGNTLDELRGKLINLNDAYERSTGKLLGTGGVFDTLFKQTSKPIVTDELLEDFEAFKSLFNQSSLSAEALAEELGGVDSRIVSYAKTCKNGELTTKGFSASLEGMTLKAKAGQVALKGLSIVGNALAGMAISFAITGLIKGIDYLINREEKLKESLSDSIDAFEATTSEIESLDEQVKTLGESIAELQKLKDTGTISIADDAELQKLKEENDELERQIALKQRQQITEGKEALENARYFSTKTVTSKYDFISTSRDEATAAKQVSVEDEMQLAMDAYKEYKELLKNENLSDGVRSVYEDMLSDAETRIDEMYEILEAERQAYLKLEDAGYALSADDKERLNDLNRFSDVFLLWNHNLTQTKESFTSLNAEQQRAILLNRLLEQGLSDTEANYVVNNISDDDLQEYWDKDFTFIPPVLTDYETAEEYGKAYAEAWLAGVYTVSEEPTSEPPIKLWDQLTTSKEALDSFTSSVNSAYDAYAKLMGTSVSSTDMLSSIMAITEAVSEMGGHLEWEFIGRGANSVELLGNAIEYVSEKYAKSVLSDAGIDVNSKFGQMLANNIIQAQKAAIELENVNTQVDSLQSAYNDLTDIVNTYNNTGRITFDHLQTLLEMEPQYLSCLIDEEGQLRINEQSMLNLANQRLNDAEAQAIQQAIVELGQIALQDEKTAVEENGQAFQDQVDKVATYNSELATTVATATVGASAIRDLNAAITGAEAEGATDDQIQTVLNNLQTKLKLIGELRGNINEGGLGFALSGDDEAGKDYIDAYMAYMETALEAGKIDYETYSTEVAAFLKDMYDKGKIAAKDYHDYTKQMLEVQKDAYDKAISAVIGYLDDQIEDLEEAKDRAEETYQFKIDSIQEEIDLLQKENDERQRQIDLEKAEYELQRALSQRTKKIYTGEKGYIYDTDAESIRDSQDELYNQKYEMNISRLESQIESLEEEMKNATDTLDDQIEKLNEYKEKWNDVADEYEKNQSRMYAEALLGLDWQEEVLDKNESLLLEFQKEYITIQDAIIQKAHESAAAQLEASKGAMAESTAPKNPNPNPDPNPDGNNNGLWYLVDAHGNQVDGTHGYKTKEELLKEYGAPIKMGRFFAKKFARGGKDLKDQIAWTNEYGSEAILSPSRNAILTPIQNHDSVLNPEMTKNLWKWAEINPNMFKPLVKAMDYSNLPVRSDVQPISIEIGDIQLYGVQNVEDLGNQIVKRLPNVMLQAVNKR